MWQRKLLATTRSCGPRLVIRFGSRSVADLPRDSVAQPGLDCGPRHLPSRTSPHVQPRSSPRRSRHGPSPTPRGCRRLARRHAGLPARCRRRARPARDPAGSNAGSKGSNTTSTPMLQPKTAILRRAPRSLFSTRRRISSSAGRFRRKRVPRYISRSARRQTSACRPRAVGSKRPQVAHASGEAPPDPLVNGEECRLQPLTQLLAARHVAGRSDVQGLAKRRSYCSSSAARASSTP